MFLICQKKVNQPLNFSCVFAIIIFLAIPVISAFNI
jgi:hypothetical protein